jgi:quinolinate synthase
MRQLNEVLIEQLRQAREEVSNLKLLLHPNGEGQGQDQAEEEGVSQSVVNTEEGQGEERVIQEVEGQEGKEGEEV